MLYRLVRLYVKIGLHLFYKKIKIVGLENIPKNKPVLFVANHQNAMMDPILIGTHNPRILYFLARASAFKNKIASKLLNAINAIAIYRVRDGVDSKKLNEAVFKKCNKLLNTNKSILIFPEGSHSVLRKIRSLRAGFTRIAIDYLEKNPTKEFYIIPIGLNYDNTFNYAKSVKIIYGKPIIANNYFDKENLQKSKNKLISITHQKLKELSVHIEDEINYQDILSKLSKEDLLNPIVTNKKIEHANFTESKLNLKPKSKNIFYYLMLLNSLMPFLVWSWLKPKIKQIEFIATAKFSLGLTVFPLNYAVQALVINNYFGNSTAFFYMVFCFVLVFLSTKTK